MPAAHGGPQALGWVILGVSAPLLLCSGITGKPPGPRRCKCDPYTMHLPDIMAGHPHSRVLSQSVPSCDTQTLGDAPASGGHPGAGLVAGTGLHQRGNWLGAGGKGRGGGAGKLRCTWLALMTRCIRPSLLGQFRLRQTFVFQYQGDFLLKRRRTVREETYNREESFVTEKGKHLSQLVSREDELRRWPGREESGQSARRSTNASSPETPANKPHVPH